MENDRVLVQETPSRPNRIRRRLSVAFLFLLAWCVLAYVGARLLVVSAPLERADAIVILSGSNAYVERAQLAARLYKAGLAPKIILTNDNRLSGWSSAEQRNPFFYERTLDELRLAGVPQSALDVIPQPVNSTYDEAVLLRDYSENPALSSLLVVTSPYHSRRALRTFRRVFAGQRTQIGLQAAPTGFQSPAPGTWWLHRRGWGMVPLEYLKLVFYELAY